jgi:hypothetical protein
MLKYCVVILIIIAGRSFALAEYTGLKELSNKVITKATSIIKKDSSIALFDLKKKYTSAEVINKSVFLENIIAGLKNNGYTVLESDKNILKNLKKIYPRNNIKLDYIIAFRIYEKTRNTNEVYARIINAETREIIWNGLLKEDGYSYFDDDYEADEKTNDYKVGLTNTISFGTGNLGNENLDYIIECMVSYKALETITAGLNLEYASFLYQNEESKEKINGSVIPIYVSCEKKVSSLGNLSVYANLGAGIYIYLVDVDIVDDSLTDNSYSASEAELGGNAGIKIGMKLFNNVELVVSGKYHYTEYNLAEDLKCYTCGIKYGF